MHKGGGYVVSNGFHARKRLIELRAEMGTALIGTRSQWAQDREKFPLLIKLLDANRALSVQVHPKDDYALEHESIVAQEYENVHLCLARITRATQH